MDKLSDLDQHLLIASQALNGTFFEKSLIYLHEVEENGATGIMVNRPINHSLDQLMEEMEVELGQNISLENIPILLGGPVTISNGFILFRHEQDAKQTIKEGDPTTPLSLSEEIFVRISRGEESPDCLVCVGMCAWDKEQLQEEIKDNKWFIIDYNEDLLFDVPFEDRHTEALKTLGFDEDSLFGEGGHA